MVLSLYAGWYRPSMTRARYDADRADPVRATTKA
jgi:hypothetical protein